MMWASAKLNYSPDTTLLQSCEAHATDAARVFKPQELVRRCLYVKSRTFRMCEMQVALCAARTITCLALSPPRLV